MLVPLFMLAPSHAAVAIDANCHKLAAANFPAPLAHLPKDQRHSLDVPRLLSDCATLWIGRHKGPDQQHVDSRDSKPEGSTPTDEVPELLHPPHVVSDELCTEKDADSASPVEEPAPLPAPGIFHMLAVAVDGDRRDGVRPAQGAREHHGSRPTQPRAPDQGDEEKPHQVLQCAPLRVVALLSNVKALLPLVQVAARRSGPEPRGLLRPPGAHESQGL
mmetsp:Transcript_30876/g.94964  ORF Transcript_30876/g.94964 Transcript_30876/m.94964 type:complete len:218 (-) Transcript_30876:71-724(-)